MKSLAENLSAVRERIAMAARRAGRDPNEITLVAVSKTQPAEIVQAALELGQVRVPVVELVEEQVEALEAEQAVERVGELVAERALVQGFVAVVVAEGQAVVVAGLVVVGSEMDRLIYILPG